ncbi:MAG: acyl-CoA reductase [Flavobacteriales bacterium]
MKAGTGTTQEHVLSMDMRVAALAQLGAVMGHLGRGDTWPGHACGVNQEEYDELDAVIRKAHQRNGWFVEENVCHAFSSWAFALEVDRMNAWLKGYPKLGDGRAPLRTVGLILAGNIPLVGLHDVLCVWLSGHRARVKCSSQDPELVPALIALLGQLAPGIEEQITFTTGKLGEVEAVIATGSNNTARYFEHYFGHLPRIVRKSRVSVAVLDGTETEQELTALGEDVFRYFGLGCRNVAKLYLPQDFDLDRVFEAFFPWQGVANHNKYGNNYDYTRAIWLLDRVTFLDNGFLLLKEDAALASPVGALHYERYADNALLREQLEQQAASIQCIVGHGHVPFGTAQSPELGDYADGIDTIRFLLDLK